MIEFILGGIIGHWIGKNVSIESKQSNEKIEILCAKSSFDKDGKEYNSYQKQ